MREASFVFANLFILLATIALFEKMPTLFLSFAVFAKVCGEYWLDNQSTL